MTIIGYFSRNYDVPARTGAEKSLNPPGATTPMRPRPFLLLIAGFALALARIGATDALLDQVVYRLYGLSAEEVAVVEGTV